MLKKTITYEDLDGHKHTDEFHFHLRKADVAAMQLSKKGGLEEYIKKIAKEEDGDKLVEIFKDLLQRTVGRRSEDGKQFIRTQEIIDEFMQSDAYSEMFMLLATDAEAAAAFANGVIPASMNAENAGEAKEISSVTDVSAETNSEEPAWLREGRTPTDAEVRNATPEQLRMAFQRKQTDMGTTPVA